MPIPTPIKPLERKATSILTPPAANQTPGQSNSTTRQQFSRELQPLPPIHLDPQEVDKPERLAKVLMDIHEMHRRASLPMRQDPGAMPAYTRSVTTTATPANPQIIQVPHSLGRAYTGAHVVRHQGTPWNGTETVSGSVAYCSVANGGSGYITAPEVVVSGGGGSGMTAIANVQNGAVTSITITNPGSGYVSAPTVSLKSSGGATAVASLSGTSVGSIGVTSGGSGYTSAPTVILTGGGGSGATATATVTNGAISGISVGTGGSGYTSAPTVSFSGGGGGGSGASVSATLPPSFDATKMSQHVVFSSGTYDFKHWGD